MILRLKAVFAAVAVLLLVAGLGTPRLFANSKDARHLAFYNIHTKDRISVIYKRNGRYVPSAMKKIDWILRDWRRDEATKMDPKLIDTLWEIHTELESKEPIHVISGYRSRKTNNMLRRTKGGQARRSRHIVGKAADVHFPDVPTKRLRYSALIKQRGGVGYYPTSAIPFVHIDTGRVRHWPRMGRQELALLFPSGRTKHRPRGGRRITKQDALRARKRNTQLAMQIDEFNAIRRRPKTATTRLAALQSDRPTGARDPVLRLQPKLVERPSRRTPARRQVAALTPTITQAPLARPVEERSTRPSQEDRSRLLDLFTLAAFMPEPKLVQPPKLVARKQARIRQASLETTFALPEPETDAPGTARWFDPAIESDPKIGPNGTANNLDIDRAGDDERMTANTDDVQDRLGYAGRWIPAPAYDDEHPEELSYRPFPLAPLLTNSASPDDPILAHMIAPDPQATLEMLSETGDGPENVMRFVPGKAVAVAMWATQFTGEAVNFGTLQQRLSEQRLSASSAANINRRTVRTSRR